MFIAIMAALGNVLSLISIQLTPIIPSIPMGPVSVSLSADLSHLTTFIASLFGGPVIGGLTGGVGGIVAAFEFGFSKGNYVTGIGLPIGKALTGIAAGIVMSRINCFERKLFMVASTVVAYVPEAIFTLGLFVVLLPALMGLPVFLAYTISTQIVAKAFLEMVLIGGILTFLIKNREFTTTIRGYFNKN